MHVHNELVLLSAHTGAAADERLLLVLFPVPTESTLSEPYLIIFLLSITVFKTVEK